MLRWRWDGKHAVGFSASRCCCQGWSRAGLCLRLAAVPCSSPAQVDPYLPYEYTCEGMLERIHAYIQHQVGHRPCYAGVGMGGMLGRNRWRCEVSPPGMLSPAEPHPYASPFPFER